MKTEMRQVQKPQSQLQMYKEVFPHGGAKNFTTTRRSGGASSMSP
tara:strand:+ start:505 stop:639 length:135 start_codon:yes stop_codon:yes gene_type:complete